VADGAIAKDGASRYAGYWPRRRRSAFLAGRGPGRHQRLPPHPGGQHHPACHAATGVHRLLAVIGGFHLSGPAFEPVIDLTVAALTEPAPELIARVTCTHILETMLADA
jgi:hypothetical protein